MGVELRGARGQMVCWYHVARWCASLYDPYNAIVTAIRQRWCGSTYRYAVVVQITYCLSVLRLWVMGFTDLQNKDNLEEHRRRFTGKSFQRPLHLVVGRCLSFWMRQGVESIRCEWLAIYTIEWVGKNKLARFMRNMSTEPTNQNSRHLFYLANNGSPLI